MNMIQHQSYNFSYINEWISRGMTHALIDLDNTLVEANVTELYFYLKRGTIQRDMYWILWCIYFSLVKAPIYLLLDYFNRELFQKSFYRLYCSFSVEVIENAAEHIFRKKCASSRIEYTHHLIKYLKERDVHITLLSTNIEPMVKRFANEYNVSYACLPFHSKGLRCLVQLDSLRDFKLHYISQYPSSSVLAVADSKHDLPVLCYADYSIVIADQPKPWMKNIRGNYLRFPRKILKVTSSRIR